jgi:uncharacterized protein (TIGR01777 family)
MVRKPRGDGPQIVWNPDVKELDSAALNGVDVVVHLAGESIMGRWTENKKALIRESRIHGTEFLCEILARVAKPPRLFICASAVGFYGDRGDEVLAESATKGEGFLADVCEAWEKASSGAREKGIRVVNLRMGMVLSREGGALKKMLPPFKLGLGGPIGSGNQYMSWVVIDDISRAIEHAAKFEGLSGPVNMVAPNPVTNREYTHQLACAVRRPAFFPVPGAAARLIFGELAEELLLSSQRAVPAQLLKSGFVFDYSDIEWALRYLVRQS